jgi:hypothetical protein
VDLSVGLFVPGVPLPAETMELLCAFQTMFIYLISRLHGEVEIHEDERAAGQALPKAEKELAACEERRAARSAIVDSLLSGVSVLGIEERHRFHKARQNLVDARRNGGLVETEDHEGAFGPEREIERLTKLIESRSLPIVCFCYTKDGWLATTLCNTLPL